MTEEPNPIDWLDKRVEETIIDAEKHLNVPHGTLADIQHDTDYLSIVKIHATIEPLLNEALRASITRALTHPKVKVPAGDGASKLILNSRLNEKITLANEAELVSDEQAQFMRAVARLRNYYAHNVANMTKTIFEASSDLDKQTDGFNLLRDLLAASGLDRKHRDSRIVLALMRPFLFTHFALLLSALLQGIRPPPTIADILKSPEFAKRADDPT